MIKENSYFEGGVKSLAFTQSDDEQSVGVMLVGEYTFGTQAAERMTVIKGDLTVRLAGANDWVTYASGEAFNVPADSSFDIKVEQTSAYLCEYL